MSFLDEKVVATLEREKGNALHFKKVTLTEPEEIEWFSIREFITPPDGYGRGINISRTEIEALIKTLYRVYLEEEIGEPADLLSELSGMRQARRLRRTKS